MSNPVDQALEELARLWSDAGRDQLRRVPDLCGEIARLAAYGESSIDRAAMRRVQRLADAGARRLTECLAIQLRTGGYSPAGALERADCIATTGWEG
jgi:hypothetical protein